MRSIRPHAVVCSLVWGMVLGTARADVPPDLAGQRIVEVSVEGPAADYVSAQDLGIPTNAVLSRDFVQALITKLMTSGAWIDVATYAERTEGGVHLYVDLTPRIVVVRVDLRGLDAMPKDDALRALALGEGTTLDGDILTRSEEALREAYVNIGYDAPLIRVTARETDDPGRRVVVVDVKEGAPTRVASLAWLGEKPNATLDARRAVRDLPGMVLDERELEARLRAAGESLRRAQYFEAHFVLRTVERDQTRAKVTVESHVGPQYTLEITGESPLSKGDVAEALNLEAEPLVPASEAAARERVRDLYRRLGYRFPTVEMETAPARQKGHAVLRVRIAKGAQEEVVAIAFPGATHFASDYLEGQLLSYLDEELPGSPFVDTVDSPVADRAGAGGKRDGERETPKPPNSDPRRTYYEPIYDEAIEHIADLYHSEGYLAAKVGPARLLEVDARRRVVSIPVVEGPRTFLQRVTLIGQDALTPRAVLTAAGLESRQPFSYVSLEKARVGIVDLYRDHGYYFVRVEPRVAFSRDRTRADVTFEIVEGFQVYVGDIVVRGAEDTDPDLVRNRLTFERGDLFRPKAAIRSQERVLDLGVFASVNVAPADAELPERVKTIVVTVTERPGQYLESTLGFSTGEGLRGGFEYGFRNLFGEAIGLSLRVQLAYQFIFTDQQIANRFEALPDLQRLERNVTLGLAFPYVPYLPDTKLSVNGVLARDNERDFGIEKLGGTVSLAWQPLRRLTFTIAEDLERNTVDLFVSGNLEEYLQTNTDARLERLLRVPEGESVILATRASAAVDLRDSPFTPTSGAYFALNSEYARTLQTERDPDAPEPFFSNFIKVAFTASGYVPLGKAVFAAQFRVGRIFHVATGSKTYPNRAFFLGGVDTMRGYLQDALVPQDLADQLRTDPDLTVNDIVRGADAFALLRAELRFPILGDLYGGVFTDVGNSWSDPTKLLEGMRLRPTAGLGLRLATPVGPLAFDYGFILVRRKYLSERVGAFHFSIGLF